MLRSEPLLTIDYDSFVADKSLILAKQEVERTRRAMDVHVCPNDADPDLPPIHGNDESSLNLRCVILERRAYGVRLSETEISHLRDHGYESYFVRFATRKIGSRVFKRLRLARRLDLTTEYIVFHCYRDRLDRDTRRRIAALLAESVTHPHAKWESKSRI
jgi:hypothetical protein